VQPAPPGVGSSPEEVVMKALRMVSVGWATLALGAVAFLSGCASTGSAAMAQGNKIQRDRDYMAAVEHAARGRGVNVVWVNPPYERGREYAVPRR
jgi:hypothetical protein